MRRLRLDGRSLLFHEDRRELLELNDTADFIWTGLVRGDPPETVAAGLSALGAPTASAERYVADAAASWIQDGRLLPRAVVQRLASHDVKPVRLRLGELDIEFVFHGLAADWLPALVGTFPERRPRARRKLAVVAHEGADFVFLDGRFQAALDPQGLVPHVKAQLTALYADSVGDGFLAHAAGLARSGPMLMLAGAPGAGKTTLSMALVAAGWAFASDDIVRVRPDGRVEGAPFAAAVKAGSWDLLAQTTPQLRAQRPWLRADGQAVRYVRPPLSDARARPLGAFVLLERRRAAEATLEPLGAVETLTALLDSAWSPAARLEGPMLEAAARAVDAAARFRLVYDNLDDAVAALEEIDGL